MMTYVCMTESFCISALLLWLCEACTGFLGSCIGLTLVAKHGGWVARTFIWKGARRANVTSRPGMY